MGSCPSSSSSHLAHATLTTCARTGHGATRRKGARPAPSADATHPTQTKRQAPGKYRRSAFHRFRRRKVFSSLSSLSFNGAANGACAKKRSTNFQFCYKKSKLIQHQEPRLFGLPSRRDVRCVVAKCRQLAILIFILQIYGPTHHAGINQCCMLLQATHVGRGRSKLVHLPPCVGA